MPLKIENIKLAGTKFDGRAKLSPEQRQAIQISWPVKDINKEGWLLCSMLASGLHNYTISSCLRKHSKQYPTEYWTELKRKCRKRKLILYKNGNIKLDQQAEK
ncbi:hypothetical protein NXW37_00075 [Bacteroides thetaiotaomicron]|nr:hypothetical protein [Bacteroides thetaiotaomicron]